MGETRKRFYHRHGHIRFMNHPFVMLTIRWFSSKSSTGRPNDSKTWANVWPEAAQCVCGPWTTPRPVRPHGVRTTHCRTCRHTPLQSCTREWAIEWPPGLKWRSITSTCPLPFARWPYGYMSSVCMVWCSMWPLSKCCVNWQ